VVVDAGRTAEDLIPAHADDRVERRPRVFSLGDGPRTRGAPGVHDRCQGPSVVVGGELPVRRSSGCRSFRGRSTSSQAKRTRYAVARQSGTYSGICAEFCGAEHSKMGITVVAEDSATFREWARQQLADATPPNDSLAAEGRQLFESGPCMLCHTVRGTSALAQVAPDLTHVGSRSTIGAGALPNTLGNLEAWIANAQVIKRAHSCRRSRRSRGSSCARWPPTSRASSERRRVPCGNPREAHLV